MRKLEKHQKRIEEIANNNGSTMVDDSRIKIEKEPFGINLFLKIK